jgi:peptidyl-prolyl isomerase E (cyclophilin E)
MASVVNAKCTLFCGGLIPSVTEELVQAAFIPFGDIVKIQMPVDSETGAHKGFCFVEYEEKEDCKEAIENMNGAELYGKVLRVQHARAGKYQEISNKAVWDEEEYIKDKTKEVEDTIKSQEEAAERQAQEAAAAHIPKKQRTFKDVNANPKVYFDISMDGVPTGRIVFQLFKDVVPKTAEK